jgi:hypothetical protein
VPESSPRDTKMPRAAIARIASLIDLAERMPAGS